MVSVPVSYTHLDVYKRQGYENNRISCYWDSDTDMTHPLILAKIPVKNPWEIFAYLPFGNWNEMCIRDSRQTVEYLEFTHSNGVEMDFHFAIDVVTDLAAILLELSLIHI